MIALTVDRESYQHQEKSGPDYPVWEFATTYLIYVLNFVYHRSSTQSAIQYMSSEGNRHSGRTVNTQRSYGEWSDIAMDSKESKYSAGFDHLDISGRLCGESIIERQR